MRRSTLAVAMLLAAAPLASATEITPNVKPDVRVIEAAAPSIQQKVVVAPARAEARSTESRATVQRSTTTTVILVLAVIGVIAILAAVL